MSGIMKTPIHNFSLLLSMNVLVNTNLPYLTNPKLGMSQKISVWQKLKIF